MTLNATVNPTSRRSSGCRTIPVRSAAGAVLPRKRPFFLDGIEQCATPNNPIYTRRVVARRLPP
jgi:hypothetical protein